MAWRRHRYSATSVPTAWYARWTFPFRRTTAANSSLSGTRDRSRRLFRHGPRTRFKACSARPRMPLGAPKTMPGGRLYHGGLDLFLAQRGCLGGDPADVVGAVLRRFSLAHKFLRHLWVRLTPMFGQMAHQHRRLLNRAYRVPDGLFGRLAQGRQQAVRGKGMSGVAAVAQRPLPP